MVSKVRKALRKDRSLPQSARRYGEWLLGRPVRNRNGVYRGGQKDAADALGITVRTANRCEEALDQSAYFRRLERGVRFRTNSTFRLTYNRSECPVDMDESTGTRGQVEDLGSTGQDVRLYMTNAAGTAKHTAASRFTTGLIRLVRHDEQEQGRIEEQAPRTVRLAALSPWARLGYAPIKVIAA